jgi:hypothetical protein
VIALLRIRRLAREFHWTPREILEAPRQLVHDLLEAGALEAQLRR